MLKYNTWCIEHMKIAIMTRQIYIFVNLIAKFQTLETKLLNFKKLERT